MGKQLKTDVTRIEIERVGNGWQATVYRSVQPHVVKLVAHTYGEISDLVFSNVAESDLSTKQAGDGESG